MSITAALVAFAPEAASASAGQVPKYELRGFPIGRLQISVVRTEGMQEQSPSPALTVDRMPVSPNQIAVIRTVQQAAHGLHRHADD